MRSNYILLSQFYLIPIRNSQDYFGKIAIEDKKIFNFRHLLRVIWNDCWNNKNLCFFLFFFSHKYNFNIYSKWSDSNFLVFLRFHLNTSSNLHVGKASKNQVVRTRRLEQLQFNKRDEKKCNKFSWKAEQIVMIRLSLPRRKSAMYNESNCDQLSRWDFVIMQ